MPRMFFPLDKQHCSGPTYSCNKQGDALAVRKQAGSPMEGCLQVNVPQLAASLRHHCLADWIHIDASHEGEVQHHPSIHAGRVALHMLGKRPAGGRDMARAVVPRSQSTRRRCWKKGEQESKTHRAMPATLDCQLQVVFPGKVDSSHHIGRACMQVMPATNKDHKWGHSECNLSLSFAALSVKTNMASQATRQGGSLYQVCV